MIQATGYAAKHSFSKLKPMTFERKSPKPNEVQIAVDYCGVCHSDVHQARNEWKNTVYPCMPGHEIVGHVVKAGSKVKKFKEGDVVGVGCMISSCGSCKNCKDGLEQYCTKGFLATYNGNMSDPSKKNNTFGGYSDTIVVREDFVLKIPKNLDIKAVGPILCAGVTTYSPLKHWKVGKGTKVGIVGFGGLGQMAVKLAKAMGANVTVFTSTKGKVKDAKKVGANEVVYSEDEKAMKKHEGTFEFILSTIPQPHDANTHVKLLKLDGVLTVVGCVAPLSKPLDMSEMMSQRRSVGTSLIGGIRETQEVLNFCSKHKILPTIKVIGVEEINEAFDDLDKGAVDFRYVIDMATLTS